MIEIIVNFWHVKLQIEVTGVRDESNHLRFDLTQTDIDNVLQLHTTSLAGCANCHGGRFSAFHIHFNCSQLANAPYRFPMDGKFI